MILKFTHTPFLFLSWLLALSMHPHLTATAAANSPAVTVTETRFSCVGVRSTNIDRQYCEAVYPDTPCNSWEECNSAPCSSTCAQAGCECSFLPGNCSTAEEPYWCGMETCQPPEESVYVGSCGFLSSEDTCESITGCSWEPWDTSGRFTTRSESESSSSTNWIAVFLTVLAGLAFLALVGAAVAFIYWKKQTASNSSLSNDPNKATGNDEPPLATATAIEDLEDHGKA